MGEKIYEIPEETGAELEGYFDKRQYPYVKREGKDEFVVMVHSKPFGKAPLSPEELEEREEVKREKKETTKKRKLEVAERKLKEAKDKRDALKEED